SGKHGGHGQRIELTEGLALIQPPADDLLALDEAIQRLQAEEPRLGEIVQLRYYAGLSLEETAGVVGRSGRPLTPEWPPARAAGRGGRRARTITREWGQGRAWLAGRLRPGEPPDEGARP